MIQDIDKHIEIINDSLAWAREYGRESFPVEQFKEYRRRLMRIRKALNGNCSAAAYGESQVGKSYLMSSLLSSATHPFVIENNGHEYSFINDINPSGGNNTKIESTGVITRFTMRGVGEVPRGMVRVLNLSVIDIILLLVDSYYNDIKINPDTILPYDVINRQLESLAPIWGGGVQHDVITEDDIKDINDYIRDVVGNSAAAIYQSNFCRVVASVIRNIPYDKWVDVFSLLWNRNPELDRLFVTLINAYKKLGFRQEVYVPFDAVLRSKGTLLKIQWLDSVCGVQTDTGADVLYTDVFDREGRLVASNFGKGELSALIAELSFELPSDIAIERPFLREMDLLDFPGARSREKYKEKEIGSVLPKMLRRGKVAYLFNKYSRALQISSVLFCHHNDQKSEPTIGETINSWIEENIGNTPEERAKMLRVTNGIAPLFFVATKFNIDLERTRNDKSGDIESLDKHWNRFDMVFPEIIKPNKWFDEWSVTPHGQIIPFRNVYPLRDFYYSAKNGLFEGYSDGSVKSSEKARCVPLDYPDYFDRLRESFLRNRFVTTHFDNPEKAWESFASLNNDGSKAIIHNLDSISGVLDRARREKYHRQLEALKTELINALRVFYVPEDSESKNQRVRLIAGDIRRSLTYTVATNPVAFGRVIDHLMINSESLRNIAYDIIIRHTDAPHDFAAINLIRALAGIDLNESREANVNRLLDYYILTTEEELRAELKKQGHELNDVISKSSPALATVGDVVTKHIVDYWIEHLNAAAHYLTDILPHADEVIYMLVNLFRKLDVRNALSEKINDYTTLFSETEQANAIGDYASLTLNNFVSSVGRQYMSDDEIDSIRRKAENCRLPVDLSPAGWDRARRPQPLMETLKVFDAAADIVNDDRIDLETLRKLPFWNNYRRWENFVFIGLIYSSDISQCDPVCNGKVRSLIERANPLYES